MTVPFYECKLAELEIDPDKELHFDTETCGLYGRIRLAQFYQEHWESVALVNNPNPFELATFLNKYHSIMHNSHYDITCVQIGMGKGIKWEPEKYDDTLYLARLKFYNRERFNLDDIKNILVEGENTIAIQVHNSTNSSSGRRKRRRPSRSHCGTDCGA